MKQLEAVCAWSNIKPRGRIVDVQNGEMEDLAHFYRVLGGRARGVGGFDRDRPQGAGRFPSHLVVGSQLLLQEVAAAIVVFDAPGPLVIAAIISAGEEAHHRAMQAAPPAMDQRGVPEAQAACRQWDGAEGGHAGDDRQPS